ncbi:tannase/feruloyl esterase family alpha/beta hydrolase [Variovorax sp. J22P240]|uniref:tannase/feruloyl esterase family alpha/beta hydrolase n=1 Tax=Variovorax sp. J22P240 TaxID=3053514 RepID=UPI0025780A13|nr:tannase/feruloyl esterase family alpha/beta hydrolase [Variovorax sp. J22P240]MDM0000938.1 tannase/feruloyl esterase family alpha/beta hydrolase [Variovorax sp. J22P240]
MRTSSGDESRARTISTWARLLAGIAIAGGLAACGGGGGHGGGAFPVVPPGQAKLTCDDTLKTRFTPDPLTQVLLVRSFKAGDPLLLSGTASANTPVATSDVCVVKLLVGPGKPGPADAPSTSQGIGIEIWLPSESKWNQRIHVKGGGGWAGGVHTSLTALAGISGGTSGAPAATAMVEGAVSASTDTGHANTVNGGSFAMNPDGSINTVLWNDFAQRGIHEMAVKTKALTQAYYGTAAKRAYWNGFSTGGRQGHMEAQANPADFDGILAGAPAINWTKFITAELYPQIVYQRDLGGVPLTSAQAAALGNAAINACDTVGNRHLGYIPDPFQCRYDPTQDLNVICASSGGNAPSGDCVTQVQAVAMNKIWYGQTADGSAPSPSTDNGTALEPQGAQRWYGLTRGTNTSGLGGPTPFTIASDVVALELQDASYASSNFVNATRNGADRWKTLSYLDLSNAYDRGVALQTSFANINTDDNNLAGFAARGGKMLVYHGLADTLIPPQGTLNYYNRLTAQMGGDAVVKNFYRLFLVPGMAHGFSNGTANPAANPPLPTIDQLYLALTAWVEQDQPPSRIDISSPVTAANPTASSRPICMHPTKPAFVGTDPLVASSYNCS